MSEDLIFPCSINGADKLVVSLYEQKVEIEAFEDDGISAAVIPSADALRLADAIIARYRPAGKSMEQVLNDMLRDPGAWARDSAAQPRHANPHRLDINAQALAKFREGIALLTGQTPQTPLHDEALRLSKGAAR